MLHRSGDKVIIPQKLVCLYDISVRQHLTDVGAADDLSFLVPLLVNNKIAVSVLRRQALQHRAVPGCLVSKVAVRTRNDDPGVHVSHQDVGDELLRCHMAYFLIKRVFYDVVNTGFLQKHLTLRVRHDHSLHLSLYQGSRRRREGEHGDLKALFLPF